MVSRLTRLIGLLAVVSLSLAGCDPGGRLAQLTPQAPGGTPVILGITAEAPGGGTLATPGGQPVDMTTPAPPPQPAPTYDAALPAWTILYYGGADNGRDEFVWSDINEFEAAGSTDQVRVVAQVDWPEGSRAGTADTVRYLIRPDTDPATISSEAIAMLGETNMGDPAMLADFLSWGMSTYPANRYALFVGDFGGGWQGCCIDGATGVGEADYLSLADIDQALAAARRQTGQRLEVIAFMAGLMNQVDVLQVVQPHAAYAVAAAGLAPGSSWEFETVLALLNTDPLVDGRRFSGDLVTAFVNYQRQMAGDEYTGMAAVDLAQIPTVSAAVEGLALALAADPAFHGAIAAEGRRGAQKYAEAIVADSEQIAAVDLLHAAAIVAEIAPPGDLQAAASAVSAAVAGAVIAYDHGLGIPGGRGIAIYWPASPAAVDPLYAQVSRLPAWADYLASAAPEPPEALQLRVDRGARDTIHIANPALARSEIVGQRLEEVALVVGQEAADGRQVLRQYETIQPATVTMPGGTSASLWRDGRHESLIIWDATAGYLADSTGGGDFALFRPVDHSSIGPQLALSGAYRPGGQDPATDATATFREDDPAARRLWLSPAVHGTHLVGEIAPAGGDTFQAAMIIANGDGTLANEPGVTVTYDEGGAIYRTTRALPAGNYAVGIRATTAGGGATWAAQPFVVDPAQALDGFRAYVDAGRNVQFLYPAAWLPPTTQDGITYTSNISGTTQLQVRYYPGWAGDLAALQQEVLGTFGDVSVLLQEGVHVSTETPTEGVRTAYGYDSADRGGRTGMFLTFLRDGTGYVIDLDGPREDEATTLAILDSMGATWQFLPERIGFGPEGAARLNVSNFRMQYPPGFAYQEFNNWHRFAADAQTFVAVRVQPAARTPAEAMAGLLQTAAEGVDGFTADEPRRLVYGGFVWERNDFHYTDANGHIVAGLLLSRRDGDTEIAVWGEAPDPAGDLIRTLFLPTAATVERIPVAPSG